MKALDVYSCSTLALLASVTVATTTNSIHLSTLFIAQPSSQFSFIYMFYRFVVCHSTNVFFLSFAFFQNSYAALKCVIVASLLC